MVHEAKKTSPEPPAWAPRWLRQGRSRGFVIWQPGSANLGEVQARKGKVGFACCNLRWWRCEETAEASSRMQMEDGKGWIQKFMQIGRRASPSSRVRGRSIATFPVVIIGCEQVLPKSSHYYSDSRSDTLCITMPRDALCTGNSSIEIFSRYSADHREQKNQGK